MRLKKLINVTGASSELLLPNEQLASGRAGLRSRELFNDIEWNAGQTDQKKWRDAIGHAPSKTKGERPDNSESFREPRLFRAVKPVSMLPLAS